MSTILVVDDEVDIVETLASLLEADGYRVVTAFDGQQALHTILEERPDLVLTDLMMPRMDGAELIARLRAAPETAGLKILVMSATRHQLDVPAIRKPFQIDALRAAIRRVLGE